MPPFIDSFSIDIHGEIGGEAGNVTDVEKFVDRHKRDVLPDDLAQKEVHLICERANPSIGYDWLPSKAKLLVQQGFAEANVLRRALGLGHHVVPDLPSLGT